MTGDGICSPTTMTVMMSGHSFFAESLARSLRSASHNLTHPMLTLVLAQGTS